MKKIISNLSTLLVLVSAALFTACNNEIIAEENLFEVNNDLLPEVIEVDNGKDASTRTAHGEDSNGKLRIVWAESDSIEIYNHKKENLAKYKALNGGSTHTSLERVKVEANITPVGPYLAIYPIRAFVDGETYNLNLQGQVQQESAPFDHLADYNLMVSKTTDLKKGLNFDTQTTIFKYDLSNIPSDLGKPVSITVSVPYADDEQGYKQNFADAKRVTSATLKLEGYKENTNHIVAHMTIAPMALKKGSNLMVTINGTKNSYKFCGPTRPSDRTYDSNVRYTLTVSSDWKKIESVEAVDKDCIYTDEMDEAVKNPNFNWSKYAPNGKGNPAKPFEIANAWNLAWLKAHYKYGKMNGNQNNVVLLNDIVVRMNKNWTPIDALQRNSHPIFDGKGHTISGWKIIDSKDYNQGFFGQVRTFNICNLTVEGTISTQHQVENIGGVIAKGVDGTIYNCTSKVSINAENSIKFIGGIIGSINTGTISTCTNWGDIYAPKSHYANGIVGKHINTIIFNNTNKANIANN